MTLLLPIMALTSYLVSHKRCVEIDIAFSGSRHRILQQSSRENCRFLESPDIEMGLYCLATRYCLPDILGVSAGILTTDRVGIDQIETQ